MAGQDFYTDPAQEAVHPEARLPQRPGKRRMRWTDQHTKILILGIVLAALLVGTIIYAIAKQKKPDYTLGLITSYSMPETGVMQIEDLLGRFSLRSSFSPLDRYMSRWAVYQCVASRLEGRGLILWAISISRSVVSPMAETTRTTSCSRHRACRHISAARRSLSISARELPPNFCTISMVTFLQRRNSGKGQSLTLCLHHYILGAASGCRGIIFHRIGENSL